MKVKEISVSTGRKIGLPGYSSIDFNTSVTVQLGEKDDVKEAFKKAWATVEGQVIDQLKAKQISSPIDSVDLDDVPGKEWIKGDVPAVKPKT